MAFLDFFSKNYKNSKLFQSPKYISLAKIEYIDIIYQKIMPNTYESQIHMILNQIQQKLARELHFPPAARAANI